MKTIRVVGFALLLFSQLCAVAEAACDCGSTSATSPCQGSSIDVTVASKGRSVSFNWEFQSSGGGNAACGQFANGDYWVAPAAADNGVRVTSVTSSGSGSVMVDADPQLESLAYLSYGNFNEDEVLQFPATFRSSTSLVAAVKKDEATHGNCGTSAIEGRCIDTYHVVTILRKVPEGAGLNILRPNIDEPNKEADLLSLTSSFDLSRLPQLDHLDQTDYEVARLRWSHHIGSLSIRTIDGEGYSEGGRAFRADQLVDDYAAGTASLFYSDLLAVMSNSGAIEGSKRAALAALLTYGKDVYYAIYQNGVQTRSYGSGAGQSLGNFPPAAFFAALAVDRSYAETLRNAGTSVGTQLAPQEFEQINHGRREPVWGDGEDDLGSPSNTGSFIGSYWGSVLNSQCFDGATGECNPNQGAKNQRDPYGFIDGPPNKPGYAYMAVSLGPMKSFVATHASSLLCSPLSRPRQIR